MRKEKGQIWSLSRLAAPVIVIGDSNINRISHTPIHLDIQLISYSGAKFTHFLTSNILVSPRPEVKHVIFSAGINSTQMNETTIDDQLRKIAQKLKKTFPRAAPYIPQLNFSTLKPLPIVETFRRINQALPKLSKYASRSSHHSRIRISSSTAMILLTGRKIQPTRCSPHG